MRVGFLGSLLVVVACSSPTQPPQPKKAVRLEVPSAMTVDGTAKLSVAAFDEAGARVEVTPTFASSSESVVTVSSDGTLTAVKTPSTAQVTVTVDALTATVRVATVKLVPGAVTVTDAQLGRTLTPGAGPFGPGFRYEVELVGVSPPAAGTILVASETAPVAGKVVSSSGQKVLLELVPLSQVFEKLEIKEMVAGLPRELTARARQDFTIDGTRFTLKQAAGQPLESEFALGPFDCVAETGLALGIDTADLTLDDAPVYEIDVTTEHQHLVLNDAPTVTLTLEPSLKGELAGTLDCRANLYTREVPVPGPVGIFIGAILEAGVGFGLEAKTQVVAGVGLKVVAQAKGTVRVGVDCVGGTCTPIHDVTVQQTSASAVPTVDFKLPTSAPKMELGAEVYAYADAKVGVTILRRFKFETPREVESTLVEGKVGLKASANLATEAKQLEEKGYSSSYGLGFHAEVGPGEELGLILQLLNASNADVKLEKDVEIGKSPAAALTLNQATYAMGDTVEATVDFDPMTITFPLFGDNLKDLRLVRQTSTGGTVLVAQQQPVMGQAKYTLTAVATEAGPADRYALFVTSKLLPSFSLEQELKPPSTCTPPAGFLFCLKASTGYGRARRSTMNGDVHYLEGSGSNYVVLQSDGGMFRPPQVGGRNAAALNGKGTAVYINSGNGPMNASFVMTFADGGQLMRSNLGGTPDSLTETDKILATNLTDWLAVSPSGDTTVVTGAQDINDVGDSCGYAPIDANNNKPVQSGIGDLPLPAGKTKGVCNSINNRGESVGWTSTALNVTHATMWRNGQVVATFPSVQNGGSTPLNDRGEWLLTGFELIRDGGVVPLRTVTHPAGDYSSLECKHVNNAGVLTCELFDATATSSARIVQLVPAE